jgi:hypothetical protein
MSWQDCATAISEFSDLNQIAEVCHEVEPRGFGGYRQRIRV